MFTEDEVRSYAKYLIKRETHKRCMKVTEISTKLEVDVKFLRTKLARGSYSAGFFLNFINALGCKNIDMSDFDDFINNLRMKKISADDSK